MIALDTVIRKARHLVRRRAQDAKSYRDLGWEDLGPWEPGDEYYGHIPCPDCGRPHIASVLQTWENVGTDDYHYVDHFWCANGHMWTHVESRREQRAA